jgi:hypothetical protein
VTRFLKPALGRHPLAKLEPAHVSQMLVELPAHLSPTTRRYVYVVLRIALGRAVKRQLVVRNVATLIDPRRRPGGRTPAVGRAGEDLPSLAGPRP